MRTASWHSHLRMLWCALVMFVPRRLRPRLLGLLPGFDVHPTSSIGFSFLCPSKTLFLGPGTFIGHLNFCRGLERVELGAHSRIGNLNWITGYPRRAADPIFAAYPARVPELVLEEHAAITRSHYVDCTDSIRIGAFATVGGLHSVLLTHSITLQSGRQACRPIRVGRYCLVGTNSVLLGGSVLPDFSALGALSMLRDAHDAPYRLYAGNPARAVRDLDPDANYFHRTTGAEA